MTPDVLPILWLQISEVLRPAIDRYDEFTLDDIRILVTRGVHHCWIWAPDNEIEAVMICTVRTYPRKRTYLIQSIAGTGMKEWSKFLPMIEDFATALGCTEIETRGRKGWAKLSGFELSEYVCRKQIGGE